MARYHRLRGDRVWFLTGTDEHGDKIAQAAAQAGVSPQEHADRNAAAFREAWQRLGISHDDFIRTTEPRHQRVVQQILTTLWEAGEIYLGKYGGQYCFGCERFYTDKEIVDGRCPDHQTPLTYIEEENYFFRMSAYQQRLAAALEAEPARILPERYRNEVLAMLRDEALGDLCISRPKTRLRWGIERRRQTTVLAATVDGRGKKSAGQRAGAVWARRRTIAIQWASAASRCHGKRPL